jgi:hypothetical protein
VATRPVRRLVGLVPRHRPTVEVGNAATRPVRRLAGLVPRHRSTVEVGNVATRPAADLAEPVPRHTSTVEVGSVAARPVRRLAGRLLCHGSTVEVGNVAARPAADLAEPVPRHTSTVEVGNAAARSAGSSPGGWEVWQPRRLAGLAGPAEPALVNVRAGSPEPPLRDQGRRVAAVAHRGDVAHHSTRCQYRRGSRVGRPGGTRRAEAASRCPRRRSVRRSAPSPIRGRDGRCAVGGPTGPGPAGPRIRPNRNSLSTALGREDRRDAAGSGLNCRSANRWP